MKEEVKKPSKRIDEIYSDLVLNAHPVDMLFHPNDIAVRAVIQYLDELAESKTK